MQKSSFLLKFSLLIALSLAQFFCSAQTIIHKDNYYGLIDSSGTYLLALEYEDVHELLLYDNFRTHMYQYKKDNKYGLYNARTKANTGLVIDTIEMGYQKGTYAFRSGNLWGFVIEPQLHKFDWVLPKYKEIRQWSDGISPFVPDPYFIDYQFKGFSVRVDSLWGYASYHTDSLLIPMQYKDRIEKLDRTQGDVYVSRNYEMGGGYIIHPKTYAAIKVSDVIMTEQFGDYFVDDYFMGDSMYVRVHHLPDAKMVMDVDTKSFEGTQIDYKMISPNIMEFNGEAKRRNQRQEEDHLRIWYDLTTGQEILRMKTANCRELSWGGQDAPTEVWMEVVCGGGNSKIIGHVVDGKFVKE